MENHFLNIWKFTIFVLLLNNCMAFSSDCIYSYILMIILAGGKATFMF